MVSFTATDPAPQRSYMRWDAVNLGIRQFAMCYKGQMPPNGAGFTRIIGVSRGGLIPAVMLSHALDIPMVSLEKSGLVGGVEAHDSLRHWFAGSESLLVDDIWDTGATAYKLAALLPYSPMFTLCYKPNIPKVGPKSLYWPGFVVPDDEWIVFPWENA